MSELLISKSELDRRVKKRDSERLIECVDSFAIAMVRAHENPSIRRHLNMPFKEVLLELAINNIHFKYVGEEGKDE